MLRLLVSLAVLLCACGRSPLDPNLEPDPPMTMTATQREQPLFVFTSDADECPGNGVESDLNVTTSGDRLVLIHSQPQGECSNAGGEYVVGREQNTTRDYFFGSHACYFLPRSLSDNRQLFWGLARVSQTAALFEAPQGWCITQLDGHSQLASDSIVKSWALYPNEKAAREALGALKTSP
ncbi:MAG: hypothetical protein QM817_31995 [Archangium sp.]